MRQIVLYKHHSRSKSSFSRPVLLFYRWFDFRNTRVVNGLLKNILEGDLFLDFRLWFGRNGDLSWQYLSPCAFRRKPGTFW